MTSYRIGLTGSIGMGKSTTAGFFAAAGIPVWDADAAVHRIYAPGGGGATALSQDFSEAVQAETVSRETLKRMLAADPKRLSVLESVIHPLVAADREAFLRKAKSDIAVLDIPLLYEKASETLCDTVLLCTAPPELQRQRVLARPGMTEAQFAFILNRQMPDREKRARADHIVETLSFAATRAYVEALIALVRAGLGAKNA